MANSVITTDIEKLQGFMKEVQSFNLPRWTSRKLWISIALIGALVFLFYTSLSTIVWPVTVIACVYMLTSVYETKISTEAKTEIKQKLIDAMLKSGPITPDEANIINQVN